jgi:hypothetical protein
LLLPTPSRSRSFLVLPAPSCYNSFLLAHILLYIHMKPFKIYTDLVNFQHFFTVHKEANIVIRPSMIYQWKKQE